MSALIKEEPLPKARKEANMYVSSAAKKGDLDEVGNAQHVLRASRKAALASSISRKKIQHFNIADTGVKRTADPDDTKPIARLRTK